mmetsp:Transcript_83820/g.233815  ORF Transcript_83820/g.233815 Transcript_83820/m.233815 type:complete len:920 (-) Transcript_83820:177-2936(-)
MTWDDRGIKRSLPAKFHTDDGEEDVCCEKRNRTEALIPDPSLSTASSTEVVSALEQATKVLRERPFGLRPTDYEWGLKRRIYSLLPDVASAATERGLVVRRAAAGLVDQLIRSGYAQSARDRRALVASGAWRPCLAVFDEACETPQGDSNEATVQRPSTIATEASETEKAVAVFVYIHLSEHVNFYDDFSGTHPDFWNPAIFLRVLHLMPRVLLTLPADIQADQWEMMCPDLEAALKCLGSFLLFWSSKDQENNRFSFDLQKAMPLLDAIVDAMMCCDERFGAQISAKNRGDPLEEITRLLGVLTQIVVEKFEADDARQGGASLKDVRRQACLLLNLQVRVLMLRIPTCAPKADSLTGGPIPVDERQQDTEWIANIYERCEDQNEPPVKPTMLVALFKAMSEMPLEEQRYRLECVSALVPPFIAVYVDELKQKNVPVELADLKTVMNAVLQDDASVAGELLEELSFYPCLLDFATKRATIHAACDRLKVHAGAGEPIRLVVPRDNVLDGVCSTLNLQDQTARIDVPLEIEFRAGYADDTGNELVDEGEDQGGLRRQWLDRASRYFISSDLFMSPSEDAAHLDCGRAAAASTSSSATVRREGEACSPSSSSRARGRIFVPAPEPVCNCVQEDWQDQFELFGCVLGFAILYKETIPVHFGHNFLRSIFGLKTDAEDLLPLLESVDKTLHTKFKYILSGGYKALGDTLPEVLDQSNLPRVFAVSESHCQELVKSTLLKKDGDTIAVTEENKEEFVMLLLDRVLISSVARQVECFQRGLLRVVPSELVQRIVELMTVKEIELMVCGADEIDVEDWERHTHYEDGYTKDSQPVKWFWEVVRGMSEQTRAALLSFTTGSSQVPSGGFRFLQPELFTIQRVRVTDRYPEAHTCANMLDLPEYTSLEDLAQRLRFAIEETGDAFGRR